MRVLLIAGEYPPYMFGGGATFMYYLSRGLADKGMEVTVVSMKFSKTFIREIDIEEHGSKLRVIRVSVPVYFYPRHDAFQLIAKSLISKLIKEHDIVHMNTGLYYPFLRDVINGSRKPAIVTIHGDLVLVYKLSLNLCLPASQVIYGLLHMCEAHTALKKELKEPYPVFVSKSLYETMKSKYEIPRYNIIYNGLNFSYIDKAINSNSKTEFYKVVMNAKKCGYKILVYPARLYPIKNHSTLIKILCLLVKKCNSRTLLVLTNDGISKQSIIRLAKKLDVSKYILMTGKLPYDETLRILNLADAVAYVSLYEAHPLSLVEALYLDKPVVTFNISYAREIKDICFPLSYPCKIKLVNNIKEFINELLDILLNDNIKNQKKTFIRQFSVDFMINSYMKLYENALNE
ncbi:MAG: glycosyltransferase family 4 protein [Candidatus Methanomethylicia archaeon]